jgi:hypothetical protein
MDPEMDPAIAATLRSDAGVESGDIEAETDTDIDTDTGDVTDIGADPPRRHDATPRHRPDDR